MKLAIRHQPAKSDVEHERNFWCWKYELREEECEELAGRLRDLLAAAQEWKQATESRLAGTAPDWNGVVLAPDRALFEAIDKAEETTTRV